MIKINLLKKYRKLIERIFPLGIDSETFFFRINQIKNLIFCLSVKDSYPLLKKDALVIVNTKNFRNAKDNNMEGFLAFLNEQKINYNLVGQAPTNLKKIKINGKDKNFIMLNRTLMNFLLKSLFVGLEISMRNFWLKVISNMNPKYIFAYQPTEELCSASLLLGKKVFEIQHGAVRNYQPITRRNKPNIYLAWDKVSLEYAKKYSLAKDYFLFGYPEFYFLKKFKKKFSSRKKILVTLTNTMKNFYADISEISITKENSLCIPNLEKAICSKELKNIDWIIRHHPLTSKNEISIINKNIKNLKKKFPNISLVVDNKKTLIEQIAISDLHISLNSSATFKCSDLDVKTILTCPYIEKYKIFETFHYIKNVIILKRGYSANDLLKVVKSNLYNSGNIKEYKYNYKLNNFFKVI